VSRFDFHTLNECRYRLLFGSRRVEVQCNLVQRTAGPHVYGVLACMGAVGEEEAALNDL
jgi:hypothetical protein